MDDLRPEARYGLACYYAGSEDCQPRHAWRGIRDHWLFHLVHSGRGEVKVAGALRRLGAGEGFLAPPDTEVLYRADGADPWSYSWIACAGSAAAACLAACGLGPGAFFYRSGDAAFTARQGIFASLIGRLAACRDDFLRTAWLYEALAGLRQASADPVDITPPAPAGRPADAYWEAVREFVRANYSRGDARIEQLAARIGVSRKHLSEVVRRRCGLSPRALLSEYRLDRAAALLEGTALSVRAIASSVGFADQMAFSKAFRRAKGRSPSAWRKGAAERTAGLEHGGGKIRAAAWEEET
jgi:AraC-like DNA-binding protein